MSGLVVRDTRESVCCAAPAALFDAGDNAASGPSKRAVMAGVNDQGIELARRMGTGLYSRLLMVGFFDDRADIRANSQMPVLGSLKDLPRFAKDNNIDVIYISLPMQSQPRMLALLDELRDTTASIYSFLTYSSPT